MKKHKIFLPFLLLFISISVTYVSSCKKEELTKNELTSQITDSELSAKIVSFRDKMIDTRKASSNETMNFGEALWMMEAAFNYYHGFTEGDYLSTQTDSVYLSVNYNQLDEVALSELQQIFVNTNNAMLTKFESIALENKRTILFDLDFEATTDGHQILIMMTSGTLNTQKSTSTATVTDPFGSTDYWTPGYITDNVNDATGKCGAYAGQFVGVSDATFEQEKAARAYRRGIVRPYHYFVNIETYDIYDRGGFEGDDNDCINPATMNDHFDLFGSRISYWYNYFNVSSSKQFVDLNLKNDWTVGIKGGYYLLTYIDWIKFGEKKERVDDEVPSALYRLP